MPTVRERILDEIFVRIQTLAGVGPDQILDAADPAFDGRVGKLLNDHGIVAEVYAFDDVPEERGSGSGVETFDFDVLIALAMTPEFLADRRPYAVAAGYVAEIYKLYESESDPSLQTWGDLAIRTITGGGWRRGDR